VSDSPAVPRLLAALLGIEVPAQPQAQARTPQPPQAAEAPQPPRPQGPVARLPAPVTPRREAPETDGLRMRIGRRPDPLEQRKDAEPRAARGARAQVEPARSTVAPVRDAVRRTLATPPALRSAVLVTEILGPPRALRPYGVDERA
jgi:hypothetical protein